MEILGLKISERAQDLIHELENLFGKSINVKYGNMTIGANEIYISTIVDGVPTIIIKHGQKVEEEILVHEIWHLIMKGENQNHTICFDGDLVIFLRKNYEFSCLQILLNKAHSILQHSYFFNKMLKDGYFPSRYILEMFSKVEKTYPYNLGYDCALDEHVALDVFHIFLGINEDEPRVNLFMEGIQRNYPSGFELGKVLFEESKDFRSASDEPKYFIFTLKKLFNYKSEIKVSRVGYECVYS
jgi:hypothetical protein